VPAARKQPLPAAVASCGVTIRSPHYEWVCVNPVHDDPHQRSRQPDRRGYPPRSERHWFVRKWPGTDH
jgi:hypothetical protein